MKINIEDFKLINSLSKTNFVSVEKLKKEEENYSSRIFFNQLLIFFCCISLINFSLLI